ncbi:MAG: hypothetical protein A2W34_01800 [Chloroflexi bacterium RBG_16_64_32]|nr:MAG: hypothetical protein A2W34_01800 [Chloroflexi bacterium RBG_16_64_32]
MVCASSQETSVRLSEEFHRVRVRRLNSMFEGQMRYELLDTDSPCRKVNVFNRFASALGVHMKMGLWFRRLGMPVVLISDNPSEFVIWIRGLGKHVVGLGYLDVVGNSPNQLTKMQEAVRVEV